MNLRRLSSSGAWTDVAAFLLLALALSVPSGFAPGAVLLLLLGLARWPGVLTGRIRWSRPMALWAGSVLVMGLVWSMHITDANGRISALYPEGKQAEQGTYKVVFKTGDYFKKAGRDTFFPEIPVIFDVKNVDQHYHIPLLLSPYGFSTYRGS